MTKLALVLDRTFILLFILSSIQRTVAQPDSSLKSFDLPRATIQSIIDRISLWKSEHVLARPYVTLAYAQSLDGKIAVFVDDKHVETSSNFPISGSESLLMTHGLRSIHDAIIIGGRTLGIDNPRLTNRLWGGNESSTHQPRPVVLDTHLRCFDKLGTSCRAKNPIVCCSEEAATARTCTPAGVTILPLQVDEKGTIDINVLLSRLWNDFGIKSVMVEGGCKVLDSFAGNSIVDCLCITIAPKILGKKGLAVYANLLATQVDLIEPSFFSIGADSVLLSRWLQ